MIHGEVALLVDRSQFKLVRCHLVMTCLTRDGEFKGLNLQILHKGLYTVRDGAEVVIVHLLVFRTLMAHQRASCHQQVRTGRIESFVHEEIFLFPTQVHLYLLHVVIEVAAHILCCFGDGTDGTEERGLVVEGLTCIGDEDGGDTQCVVDDEDGRCGVPG